MRVSGPEAVYSALKHGAVSSGRSEAIVGVLASEIRPFVGT